MKPAMIMAALSVALLAGCGKSVDVDGKGLYMNTSSGVVGIGEVEVVTNPEGSDAARLHYEEDTAWLSPSEKTHEFKASLFGTNACMAAASIVKDLCEAFGVNTNRVTVSSK